VADAPRSTPRVTPSLRAALVCAAVLALAAATTPGFATLEWRDGRLFGAPVDVLHRAVPAALAALGMSLVIATRGVDLSVGSVGAIAAVVAAMGLRDRGWGAPAAVVAALASGAAFGAFNGVLVARLGLQPIVATLILFTAGRGIAQLLAAGSVIAFDAPAFASLGSGASAGLPNAVWIAAAATALLAWVAHRTSFGLYVRAFGDNPAAARLAGIPVTALLVAVYAACGTLAAAAGALVAADIRAADPSSAGMYLELDAILATVLGGTSLRGGSLHVTGAVCGALILQTLTTVVLMHGAPWTWALVVKAIAVLAVCALQSPRLAAAWRARTA